MDLESRFKVVTLDLLLTLGSTTSAGFRTTAESDNRQDFLGCDGEPNRIMFSLADHDCVTGQSVNQIQVVLAAGRMAVWWCGSRSFQQI
jgi:hypothetical protein